MLEFLKSGKRIINVDETWLNQSNFVRKAWFTSSATATIPLRAITPTLSMIAALDNEGRIYFSLNHSSTDQDVFMVFMRYLVRQLDQDTPGWEEDSIILLDNATYHRGEEIRKYFRKMQLPVMYSAPYSFSTAPIETLFSHLKLGELNPNRESTGKR